MIKLITGAKGTGKTKIIIDMANNNVAEAKGDIVFITDTNDYLHSLKYKIRLINAAEILKKDDIITEDSLLGFVQGVLAGNYDIETFYIDGCIRMLKKKVGELKDFFNRLESIAVNSKVKFILTVSENEQDFPDYLKKFL